MLKIDGTERLVIFLPNIIRVFRTYSKKFPKRIDVLNFDNPNNIIINRKIHLDTGIHLTDQNFIKYL